MAPAAKAARAISLLRPLCKTSPDTRCEGFLNCAKNDEEIVVGQTTAPRSEEAEYEKNRNPEGYGLTFRNIFVAADSMYRYGYTFVLAPRTFGNQPISRSGGVLRRGL